MNTYKAVIVGSTGAVGRNVLKTLLGSQKCTQITSITRRGIPEKDNKLHEHVIPDMSAETMYEKCLPLVQDHQAAFCTLCIGQPTAFTTEEVYKTDVTMATEFAKACKDADVKHFSVLTSVETDANSYFWYLRIKAELEENIKQLGFDKATTFRPALLVTQENRYGWKDTITQNLYPQITWMLPQRFKEIKVEDLGRAMVLDTERHLNTDSSNERFNVLHWQEFNEILTSSE
jgi:uncharacterized protein YbjT (DUF2867 family)